MNKQEILDQIMADEPTTRDFVSRVMVDQQTHDFQIMFSELMDSDSPNLNFIGWVFKRAYESSINDYLTLKSEGES